MRRNCRSGTVPAHVSKEVSRMIAISGHVDNMIHCCVGLGVRIIRGKLFYISWYKPDEDGANLFYVSTNMFIFYELLDHSVQTSFIIFCCHLLKLNWQAIIIFITIMTIHTIHRGLSIQWYCCHKWWATADQNIETRNKIDTDPSCPFVNSFYSAAWFIKNICLSTGKYAWLNFISSILEWTNSMLWVRIFVADVVLLL